MHCMDTMMKRDNLTWMTLLLTLTTLLVSSCMMSSVAITGAQTVYDRHNLKKKIDDNYTTLQSYKAIYLDNEKYADTNISISTFNDTVLITGQAPKTEQKLEIENLIKPFSGGRKIYNFTEIASPSSQLTRASDSWITSKIKAKLIAVNEIDPTKIKVLTENGTVFLIGIVPRDQANIAVDIAKSTDGVQNVIKMFSYITISKN